MARTITLLSSALIANAVVAQGCLVAFYPFTGNAADASGNGHHGLAVGATLDQDRYGSASAAYRFDGVDDVIDIGNDADLQRANTDFTVSAWVSLDAWSAIRATILTNRDGTTDTTGTHIGIAGVNDTGPGYDDGELNITCVTPNNLCADTAISLQAWHHVALTYDRANAWITFYYNGLAVGEGPLPNFLEKPDVHHTIGYAPFEGGGVYALNGRLDEVAIFNCALSAAEVLDVYNGSLTMAITDVPTTDALLIYPVPTTDRLVLPAAFVADIDAVHVLDMKGRTVPTPFHNGEVDVRGLPSGIYVLQVFYSDKHYHARFQKM